MAAEREENGRFFFGYDIKAPWPENEPKGRIIPFESRHMTARFIGTCLRSQIINAITSFDFDPFFLTGILNAIILLPAKDPHCLSLVFKPIMGAQSSIDLQISLEKLLLDTRIDTRLLQQNHIERLPHVTLCRTPFDAEEWRKEFHPLTCYCSELTLFETVGPLKYHKIKSWPLLSPFEVLDHTADLAFWIHGRNYTELFYNALLALSFFYLPFSKFIPTQHPSFTHLGIVIDSLNEVISKIDIEIGSPFKAVSRHERTEHKLVCDIQMMSWEMIVDV